MQAALAAAIALAAITIATKTICLKARDFVARFLLSSSDGGNANLCFYDLNIACILL